MEFSELNVEYGYRYESAAVVPDGSAAPAPGRFLLTASDPWPSSPPCSARPLAADRLLSQGRRVPDRRGCRAAVMTVCRQGAPSANVR